MKSTLLAVLASGACATVALAEPASTTADATDGVIAEAHAGGPIPLTEAEMDRVAAGYEPSMGDKIGIVLDPTSSTSGLPIGKRQHKPATSSKAIVFPIVNAPWR